MSNDDDTAADSEPNQFKSVSPSPLVARSRRAQASSMCRATACLFCLIAGVISTGVAFCLLLTPNEFLSCLTIMLKGAAVGVVAAFIAPVLILYKFSSLLVNSLRDNLRFALPAFALTCVIFAICGASIAVFGITDVLEKVPIERKIIAVCIVATCMAVAGLVGYLVSVRRTAR